MNNIIKTVVSIAVPIIVEAVLDIILEKPDSK